MLLRQGRDGLGPAPAHWPHATRSEAISDFRSSSVQWPSGNRRKASKPSCSRDINKRRFGDRARLVVFASLRSRLLRVQTR